MILSSIRFEGGLFNPELISALDDGAASQAPADFGMSRTTRVRDEILAAWGDLRDQWSIFRRRRERLAEGEAGTTETRRFWMEPFFAALGYELELQREGEKIQGKSYAISHRAPRRAEAPVHIAGCRQDLDAKATRGGLSPHGLVQEYLNLSEAALYGIVTNGLHLRLLRDSGRLTRLSYVEFDLERMFDDELYAEFALLFRFLHASRFPADAENPADCILEKWHQSSLQEGGRIRMRLSEAVKGAILGLGNGFLRHPANTRVRALLESGELEGERYYRELLILVYRLLFLLVIEERGLVFPKGADPTKREIYESWYSLARLRALTQTPLADLERHEDWYRLLCEIFALYDESGRGGSSASSPWVEEASSVVPPFSSWARLRSPIVSCATLWLASIPSGTRSAS